MTENKELINNAQIELPDLYAANVTDVTQQVSTLRALLTLPIAQRNALLTQQAATIAEYFVTGAEEMEWTEEYVEDENWNDD